MPILLRVLDNKNFPETPPTPGWTVWNSMKNLFHVDSIEFDVEREVLEGTGAMRNREWKAPTVNAASLSRKVDNVSGPLVQWSVGGGASNVAVYMVKSGSADKGFLVYMEYLLEKCILKKYEISGDDSPEEKGSENLELSFTAAHIRFTQFDEANKQLGSPNASNFDLGKGTGVLGSF
jgi:hypothetical protein